MAGAPKATEDGSLAKALVLLADSVKHSGKRKAQERDFRGDPSDEEEAGSAFMLADALKHSLTGSLWSLEASWFADERRLATLWKHAQKARARGTCVIATSGPEDWNPSWVGGELPLHARKPALLNHAKNTRHDFTCFLTNTLVYWLSHLAVGLVSLTAVVCHILSLLQLSVTHSKELAMDYTVHLQTAILDELKGGGTFNLDQKISYIDDRILGKILLKRQAREAHQRTTPRSSNTL
jgi:hypothetical protein